MSNPNVSIFSPDKIIKDLQWDNLKVVAHFAHGKLLDVGCGSMPYKPLFQSYVSEYIGIDKNSKIANIKQDFLKAKISKRSIDTVLCTQVLEHTSEPKIFLGKIHNILKKNGVLILTVPFTGSLHEEPHDYFRYTKYGLKHLLNKTGFKVIYLIEEGNWISAINQEIIFFLEPTFNRYLLKYPKRVVQFLIMTSTKILSRLPERFIMSKHSNINYLIVAKTTI